MSREDFSDDLQSALDRAVVNRVDLDAIKAELEDAQKRVDELQTIRGDA